MIANHWNKHARQWDLIDSPLRPHRDDVENLLRAIVPGDGVHLLLGLTPEYTALFDQVVAVDCSAAMIAALWRATMPGKLAVRADWLRMPLRAASCDACIGDGSVNLLSFPLQYPCLFEQVRRVLKPRARLALRVFVRPDAGETCASVCGLARQARIGSFHAFKWRLAMAIAEETGNSNVRVRDIGAVFDRYLSDRARLAAASGWLAGTIDTIDAYKHASAAYSFPTLAQLRATLPSCLKEIELKYGGYELAERCPMLVLEHVC